MPIGPLYPLQFLTTRIYLHFILMWQSQCTRMAVVPLASLCTVWTIASVSVSLFLSSVLRAIWSMLCTSRCTYKANFLVVDGAILGETRVVCECALVVVQSEYFAYNSSGGIMGYFLYTHSRLW